MFYLFIGGSWSKFIAHRRALLKKKQEKKPTRGRLIKFFTPRPRGKKNRKIGMGSASQCRAHFSGGLLFVSLDLPFGFLCTRKPTAPTTPFFRYLARLCEKYSCQTSFNPFHAIGFVSVFVSVSVSVSSDQK